MKIITTVALMFTLSAFAHEEVKKKSGHDKEHQHVTAQPEHEHEEAHHQPHDHTAHHPELEAVSNALGVITSANTALEEYARGRQASLSTA